MKMLKMAIYQQASMVTHPDQVNALHYEKRKAVSSVGESEAETSHKVETQAQQHSIKKRKTLSLRSTGGGDGIGLKLDA